MSMPASTTLLFWVHRDPDGPGGVASTERLKWAGGAWWPSDERAPFHRVRDLAALGMRVRKGRARRFHLYAIEAHLSEGTHTIVYRVRPLLP